MKSFIVLLFSLLIISACNTFGKRDTNKSTKIRLIIDTDANNELDDQHALAYALYNRDIFDIEGITINNTRNGDGIEGHYKEAMRILQLSNAQKDIPVYKGAAGMFSEIQPHINENAFDGKGAVDFIIERAKADDDRQLVLLPIGKLTNIALALQKAPEIKDKIRVVWLGANYPAAGEYNLENDTTSVNPVIQSGVPFEMVLVRGNQPSGTAAVTITKDEINNKMLGRGVKAIEPIIGRNGGKFETFGDYSVNLFANIELHGNPPSRALYDMAAVAIVKNPAWAEKVQINAPVLSGEAWIEQPQSDKKIWIWQNFKKKEIIDDMFTSMDANKLPK
jgi:inosine-uridine nucleoside N-ribohydrolase